MVVTDLPRLILALGVIVVAARLFGMVARSLGQPEVVGEILAGILLGPTLAGGAVATNVFPTDIRPTLSTLANVGVCIFVFLIGLHFDRSLLRGQGRITTTASLSAMLVPFALGTVLALYLLHRHPVHERLGFVLFIGTAMSITAFPVLARILSDSGLIKTRVGSVALACAALDDVLAWSLLATVVAISGHNGMPWRVLLIIPLAGVLLGVVRPLLARLTERGLGDNRLVNASALVVAAGGLYLCAQATNWMGLHLIFGAFLFGVTLPRGLALSPGSTPLLGWAERLNALLLLPIFFLTVGLKVNLSDLDAGQFAVFVLILAVAVGGKGTGAFVGARISGAPREEAAVLAVLMNARGLTELIALTVGLQLGLLDRDLYSLMVLMALVTTAMTGVLLRVIYPPDRLRRDIAAPEAVQVVDA